MQINMNNCIVVLTAYSKSIQMELYIYKLVQSWIPLTYIVSIHLRLPIPFVGASAICTIQEVNIDEQRTVLCTVEAP
jgi:hypothetical protein